MSERTIVTPTPQEQRIEEHWKILNSVIDPELGVGIVDLGLIYGVEQIGDRYKVTMTFTSIGCPAGPEILDDVQEALLGYNGCTGVDIEVVWEPIWGSDMVHRDVRELLWGA